MNYNILREIADSWMLLAMFAFFLGAIFWAFRPGSRSMHDDAADVPFRHEDTPARDASARDAPDLDAICKRDCAQCKCGNGLNLDPEGQA